MYKRSKVKLSLLLFCILMLVSVLSGCSSIFSAKEGQRAIKILIVEFGSRSPIPNMKVVIKDSETDKIITEEMADESGEVSIKGLKAGKSYLFIPTPISGDASNDVSGAAQIVKIADSTSYVVLETYYVRKGKGANVPVVLQRPILPHGCEITALTSVLNFYGKDVTKELMATRYMERENFKRTDDKWTGPDPSKKYAGDPSDENNGMYAFAPVIEKAAIKYLKQGKSTLKVKNITGASKKTIISKVQKGIPVIMWVTLDLSKPKMKEGWIINGTNKPIQMYRNLHVVVMTGYQNGKVIVMDPLKGYVAHDETEFFNSFKEMKSQAIVLEK